MVGEGRPSRDLMSVLLPGTHAPGFPEAPLPGFFE
jgi:hypothetical protein